MARISNSPTLVEHCQGRFDGDSLPIETRSSRHAKFRRATVWSAQRQAEMPIFNIYNLENMISSQLSKPVHLHRQGLIQGGAISSTIQLQARRRRGLDPIPRSDI